MKISLNPLALTPRSSRTVWLASNAGLLMPVPLYTLWLHRILAGPLPQADPDVGDVPTVAIVGLAALVVIIAPFLNLALYFLLRRYPGQVHIFQDVARRRVLLYIEIPYLIIALLLGFGLLNTLMGGDIELVPIFLWWLVMFTWYRAIGVEKCLSKADKLKPR